MQKNCKNPASVPRILAGVVVTSIAWVKFLMMLDENLNPVGLGFAQNQGKGLSLQGPRDLYTSIFGILVTKCGFIKNKLSYYVYANQLHLAKLDVKSVYLSKVLYPPFQNI